MSRVRQTKKFSDGDVQRYGKALDVVQRNVPRLTLNVSDESPVQASLQGKSFLAHSAFST